MADEKNRTGDRPTPNAEKAAELAKKATKEMQMAREAMDRTVRVKRNKAFVPQSPAYRKIY